ncbi:hypothetical protein [Caballeronia sp. ATUFL_M2_KS44]|uniref:hypothetical protein n=1 Tax=Caballeronia sp. ATUFL_M2_KS44 TaxID=2921767 RepID=UPI002028707C|nr:hypothetical protein [Caballeronia sp. ATUFL_M2_KS44]
MATLQKVNLGTPPTAVDGDTARGANTKANANVDVLSTQIALVSNAATITSAQALTNAHVGKRVNINLATTGTINLPAASTCAVDQVIHLRNVGGTLVTLAITAGSGDTLSLSRLNPGESALLDTDGVHAWSCLLRGRTNSDNETITGRVTSSTALIGTAASSDATTPLFVSNNQGSAGIIPAATFSSGGAATPRLSIIPNASAAAFNPIVSAGDTAIIPSLNATGSGNLSIAPWSNSLSGIRLTADGNIAFGAANIAGLYAGTASADGVGIGSDHGLYVQRKTAAGLFVSKNGSAAGTWSADLIQFFVNGSSIGSISTPAGTSVSYNTTSDYRLKARYAPLVGATEAVLRITFYEGEFKDAPGERVHYVIAHELQAVVPHAVTGKKDAVSEDGAIVPQQVDYSKLVPLLGSALQDALKRIAILEAKVAA